MEELTKNWWLFNSLEILRTMVITDQNWVFDFLRTAVMNLNELPDARGGEWVWCRILIAAQCWIQAEFFCISYLGSNKKCY
jgi:hypothetical protein